jgi:hypothetical protein
VSLRKDRKNDENSLNKKETTNQGEQQSAEGEEKSKAAQERKYR